jgi:type II secretory pathway component GspD/PulD (secretin)
VAVRYFTFLGLTVAGTAGTDGGGLGGVGGIIGGDNGDGVNTINNSFLPNLSVQQPEIQITEVRTTVSVPDGGTLLLGGQTLAGEIEIEAGTPILSKIPFLKRLFTNRSTAKDEQVLLILVKPTIIISREIEQQQFPLLSSRAAQQ